MTATSILKSTQKLRDTMDKLQQAGIDAFHAGRKAKQQGWSRTSPYYNKPLMDECFFAGFDQQ